MGDTPGSNPGESIFYYFFFKKQDLYTFEKNQIVMEYKLINNIEWNYKTISLFAFLLVVPNFLGMINISTAFGFKLHLFQAAIFAAALVYGPIGGLFSGLVGSTYSAIIMNNPYLVVGNALLGFFTGLFAKKMHTAAAVALAFAIQLPWLVLTDYYLMSMSAQVIVMLTIALAASNLVWAFAAHYSVKKLQLK
jgi:uncharacterized membrane protein